jgi:hypothetical protein
MKRAFFAAITCALLMHAMLDAQTTLPQATGLSFFKNYFITGNYVVNGVNLRGTGVNGTAKGFIDFTTPDQAEVPNGADVVGAFLYWETVQTPNSGFGPIATFRGMVNPSGDPNAESSYDHAAYDITNIAKVLNPTGTAPCWSSGGGTGGADGAHQMFVYRADVLRFLPISSSSGKRIVKTKYEIRLPDAGSGNVVPSTAGASLVVIYKDPSKPLTSIVIYNGGYTMDNSTQLMNRTLSGFYQAGISPGISTIAAKMTHIVGDGSASKSDRLLFGTGDTTTAQIGLNRFQGLVTPSSDPAWDNVTFDASSLVTADTFAVTTTVDHDSFTPFDCLSWGAIIFSTTVQDFDNDGLLDVWESDRTTLSDARKYTDPNGVALPDLYAMGARPTVKDIFVEFGYQTTPGYTYAADAQGALGLSSPNVPAHNHLLTKPALDMVARAFRNAPAAPDGPGPINIHFDVGNNYQPSSPLTNCWGSSGTWTVDCAIIPADAAHPATSLARGGSIKGANQPITETACNENSTPGNDCMFESFPGTVGWKTGFGFLRDQPLSGYLTPVPPQTIEQACVAAGANCVRRFDHNRIDIFHYALGAHAIGLARGDDPTTTGVDESAPLSSGSLVPRNVSGVSDGGGSGGGDLMITLGLWDNFRGTDFIQASTLMHELGHNFGLRHGGGPPIVTVAGSTAEPNCKPNYLSVMNYLFQVRGLIVGTPDKPVTGNVVGDPAIDYSRKLLVLPVPSGLDENSLSEQPAGGLGTALNLLDYRTRWYAPAPTIDVTLATTPARRHCDGSFILDGAHAFRVDGTTVAGAIDWSADGILSVSPISQDITFSGALSTLKPGQNDWAAIDLRQVGSRRNVARKLDPLCSTNCPEGPQSVDQGQGDQGQGDQGQGDQGQGDQGQGDQGQGDQGQGDQGQGDQGQGDQGQGDQGAPPNDVDLDIAASLGNAPNSLTASVPLRDIKLDWKAPHVRSDHVTQYEIWRVLDPNNVGVTTSPSGGTFATRVMVGTTQTPPVQTFVDLSAKNNVWYTYFVVAVFDNGATRSGMSNTFRIKK